MRRRTRMLRTSSGAGGVAAASMLPRIGANVGPTPYYESAPVFTNLNRQGNGYEVIGGGSFAPVNASDGYPTTNFRASFQALGTITSAKVMKFSATGQCDLPTSINSSTPFTISSFNYNAGTNTTTFDLTTPSSGTFLSCWIEFTNTKRTSGSAAGSGMTDIKLTRHGYDGSTATFTNEILTYWGQFTHLRTMDFTAANNDRSSVAWADRPTLNTTRTYLSYARSTTAPVSIGNPWEVVIEASNLTDKPMWINIPVAASDDYITQLATLFFTTLNKTSNQYVILEISNENWNIGTGFRGQYSYVLDTVAAEVDGFYSNSTQQQSLDAGTDRYIVSATRSGNTITVTTSRAHGYSASRSIKVYQLGTTGGGTPVATGTYTVASAPTATSFTFTDSAVSPTDGTITGWTTSRLAGTFPVDLSYDGSGDIYALSHRWVAKRIAKASELWRAVWGDANMNTKVRPVLAWQSGLTSFVSDLAYLSQRYPTYQQKQLSETIYAITHAPYYDLDGSRNNGGGTNLNTSSSAGITVADYVATLAITATKAKERYPTEGMCLLAKKYGIKMVFYECGSDTAVGDSGATNNQKKTDAMFDDGVYDPTVSFLVDGHAVGVELITWYHAGIQLRTDAAVNSRWGLTDGVTNLSRAAAPRMAAVNAVNALSSIALTRHVVPAVIDGRLCRDVYVTTGSAPIASAGLTYGFVAVAGSYTVKLNGGVVAALNGRWYIDVNGVRQAGGAEIAIPQSGILTTYLDSNTLTISLAQGLNSIEFVPFSTSNGSWSNINQITVQAA